MATTSGTTTRFGVHSASATISPAVLQTRLPGLGGKLRGVFERCQEIAHVVEPAGRICDLLEAKPAIEPTALAETLELATSFLASDRPTAAAMELVLARELAAQEDQAS